MGEELYEDIMNHYEIPSEGEFLTIWEDFDCDDILDYNETYSVLTHSSIDMVIFDLWGCIFNTTVGSYIDHHQSFDYCTNSSLEAYNSDEEYHVAAPTQQMALAWIRKKGYYIQINFVPYNGGIVYDWKIYDKSHECIAVLPDTLDYYEECINNALEFVLFYILDTVKLASE